MSALKTVGVWLTSLAMVMGMSTAAQAYDDDGGSSPQRCQAKNFDTLFFEDYYPEGRTWVSNQPVTITWSDEASSIEGSNVTRGFDEQESIALEEALDSWASETELISFSKASSPSNAQLLIGYTDFSNVPINADGYWTSYWRNSIRYKGTIRFDVTNEDFQNIEFFKQAALHEIGNVLGLGDIRPNLGYESVMNDPWVKNYPSPTAFDGELLRQITGEELCPSGLPEEDNSSKDDEPDQVNDEDSKNEEEVEEEDEANSSKDEEVANDATDENASNSDRKLNAGSFKGYVALYAKGYEGQRLSAKVGKDWVIVPRLESNFERIVEFTGAGYDIRVRMYIDRELIESKQILTK